MHQLLDSTKLLIGTLNFKFSEELGLSKAQRESIPRTTPCLHKYYIWYDNTLRKMGIMVENAYTVICI